VHFKHDANVVVAAMDATNNDVVWMEVKGGFGFPQLLFFFFTFSFTFNNNVFF
jgi:hypothetical protein